MAFLSYKKVVASKGIIDRAIGWAKLLTERSKIDEASFLQKQQKYIGKLYCVTLFSFICGALSVKPAKI